VVEAAEEEVEEIAAATTTVAVDHPTVAMIFKTADVLGLQSGATTPIMVRQVTPDVAFILRRIQMPWETFADLVTRFSKDFQTHPAQMKCPRSPSI
jgi:hypothetical protein